MHDLQHDVIGPNRNKERNDGGAAEKCYLYDPQYLDRLGKWAIADKLDICLAMTQSEIIANFGGAQRIAQLDTMLKSLEDRQVHLMILSLGRTECMIAQLKAVRLLHYFRTEDIFGRDSNELRKHNSGESLVQGSTDPGTSPRHNYNWLSHEVLFVDDSVTHIDAVRLGVMRTKNGKVIDVVPSDEAPICRTLLVADDDKTGMTQEEMLYVCAMLEPLSS
eukprot:CAMPEP_0179472782 /NCGR_PEP_ID=MMETSP0799-20121207/52700_1 /TAXON_ID=46947 /ORGANISM="Geminigera cryophila, Strain CCMP2564" /LENGTH=219 /DNA_ID=CAMNT_0021281113 /DNA_START=55 /DNA_END=713 /DNA_ORIENTATION=+